MATTHQPKRKNNRRKNFVAIPYTQALALSTLADAIVLTADLLAGSFLEDFFCISLDMMCSLRGLTAGETPIGFGVAHGDLSVTEIAEALSANLLEPDNIIQRERARRPVRRVGTFGEVDSDQTFNNGNPKRQALRFSVGSGHALVLWVQNRSGATLTTGAQVRAEGTLYGRWQR